MIQTIKRTLSHMPVIREVVGVIYRFAIACFYYPYSLVPKMRWAFTSREVTNFTYELETINRKYLAAFVADVTGKTFEEIEEYFYELETDQDLRSHIKCAVIEYGKDFYVDHNARYARRYGWYAVTRAIKPKVVVETGVDKGLGACVITSALIRNQTEGFPGYYYGTDINPNAGLLFRGKYKEFGEIMYGDSICSLKSIKQFIDLFINDSDHSAIYEAKEYETVAHQLTNNAFVLGDNAHVTDELLKFAIKSGRQFLYFQEKPKNHWYPGAGIGFAFRRK